MVVFNKSFKLFECSLFLCFLLELNKHSCFLNDSFTASVNRKLQLFTHILSLFDGKP